MNWSRIYKIVFFAAFMGIAAGKSYAQSGDTRYRQEVILSYSPVKTLDLSGSYRLDLIENITQFERSNFEFTANYSATKWLKLITSYRYITSYNNDQHRFAIGFSVRKTSLNKKYQFQFKSTLNFISDYLDRDYWMYEDPRLVLRLRARFKYNISKKVGLTAYTETFARNFSEYRFYRMRYGTEVNYSPKKRHTLSLGYFYQHEFNRSKPENSQTFTLSYEFEFKKKKKKGTAAVAPELKE